MARRPDGITPRSEHVTARFRPETAATLDRLRKDVPRSRFLEHLVIEESRRQQKEKS